MSHAVEVLPVHKKDQQHFIYDEEGALSMGLLENDEEYVVCIRQATLDCMDEKLHELFANILVHCLLANSRALFDQFKADFMELRRCNKALPEPLSDDMMLGKAMFYTLKGFDNCFQHHRLSLWDYPTFEVIEMLYTRAALDDALATAATMTDEHRQGVLPPRRRRLRKSYVSQILLAKVCDKGDIALAVALSGLAALLLMGDTTAHSQFKINDKSLCHIPKQSSLTKIIRDTKLIVWDEVSMIHKHALEAVDRSLREIMDNPTALFWQGCCFLGRFQANPANHSTRHTIGHCGGLLQTQQHLDRRDNCQDDQEHGAAW
ncbi:hypothetical protein AaE_008621 [Aphanomyces astaci]|uniref:ATP-dependent DNA helicase n=1 Tax=Aphanomyces astaci TaxID=112090 RepID=A0A6A5A6F5_APHAT|nr:hypothetical protein AaE_008621 [Aphanomyces astaci]